MFAGMRIVNLWLEIQSREEIHSTILQRVEKLGNLELVKYRIKDVMIIERGKIPMITHSRMLAVISGEAIGCIDMGKLSGDALRLSGDTVYLKLPQPYVCHHFLKHGETKLYDMNLSLIDRAMDREEELMNYIYEEAENRILEEALRSGILEETRRGAMDFLNRFLQSLGFEAVVFVD